MPRRSTPTEDRPPFDPNDPVSILPRRQIKRFGWKRDLPDQRDLFYSAPRGVLKVLPKKADLRAKMPPVVDQGDLGSCTANAIGGAMHYLQIKQRQPAHFEPSRLFIYYNERVMEGTVGEDSGAYIRDGVKAVNKLGAPPETAWPYDIPRFTQQPPTDAYVTALDHQILQYSRVVRDLSQMKGCIAEGYPFVFGFTVYRSFTSQQVARTGTVPMPGNDEPMLGGHAVLCVGYSDSTQRFWVRNSWGPGWGKKGYFTLPYAYLLNPGLSDDFWTLRLTE